MSGEKPLPITDLEREKGLVRKLLVPVTANQACIQETWDVTNPNCPYFVFGSKKGDALTRTRKQDV